MSLRSPPKNLYGTTGKIALSRFLAEIASLVASAGTPALAGTLAPGLKAGAEDYIARHWIAPHLAAWDRFLGRLPIFVGGQPKYERLLALPEKERAAAYATELDDFTTATIASIGAQMVTQGAGDHFFGIPELSMDARSMCHRTWENTKKLGMAAALDRGTQVGAIVIMQQMTPDATERFKQRLIPMLGKIGIGESAVRRLVDWQVPNGIGMALGSMPLLTRAYHKEMIRYADWAKNDPKTAPLPGFTYHGHGPG